MHQGLPLESSLNVRCEITNAQESDTVDILRIEAAERSVSDEPVALAGDMGTRSASHNPINVVCGLGRGHAEEHPRIRLRLVACSGCRIL